MRKLLILTRFKFRLRSNFWYQIMLINNKCEEWSLIYTGYPTIIEPLILLIIEPLNYRATHSFLIVSSYIMRVEILHENAITNKALITVKKF